MTGNFLLFRLSERLFGVQLRGAIEILPWRTARSVPLSYSYVEGLLDYRGVIYPVYNLEARLGLRKTGQIGFGAEQQAAKKDGSIILLEEKKLLFGIVADSVAKMAMLEVQPGPGKEKGIDSKYIKGYVSDEEQEVTILDFERLFHAG